jgi:two-component system CheB/CheR fusion protein
MEDVQQVLETETHSEREVRDSRGNWYLMRILPYRAKTAIGGVVLTIVDVSTLKQTEEQLRRMSKVFMDGADPIIVEDLTGTIVDVNHEAVRVYGWKREELIGQSIEILVPENRRPSSRRMRERCRNQDHLRNFETVRQTKSGKMMSVLLTLSLLTQEGGEPVAVATIAKDIRRLKNAEHAAQEAVRRRDQFLAMLSHELRNPLAAVVNATRLIEREECATDQAQRAALVIQRQTDQMSRLLDDLLDVTRVTQGKIQLRDVPCDITGLVKDAVEVIRPLIDARRHKLHTNVSQRPLYVLGDCSRLLQIQTNLLSNAVKYTPPEGEIWLTIACEDDQAVIRVRDNGRGIPADMLDSIFDLFVQTDDTLQRDEGGMGVGLTLVRQLVELHGGTVQAWSEGLEKGSEFVVQLPLTSERPVAQMPVAAMAQPGVSRRVLIVEDNDDSREMLQRLLELDGHEVIAAGDGHAGLQAVIDQCPDVALIDLGLPGMDGYEVARRTRAEEACRHIRLVALTGYGRKEDRQAVLEAGFDEHLVKPVGPEELARTLSAGVN